MWIVPQLSPDGDGPRTDAELMHALLLAAHLLGLVGRRQSELASTPPSLAGSTP